MISFFHIRLNTVTWVYLVIFWSIWVDFSVMGKKTWQHVMMPSGCCPVRQGLQCLARRGQESLGLNSVVETMEIEVDELGPWINGDMPSFYHLRSGGQQYAGFLECVIACVAEPWRLIHRKNSQGFGGGLESWFPCFNEVSLPKHQQRATCSASL